MTWNEFWGNHSCAEEICPTCQGKVRQLIEENERLQKLAAADEVILSDKDLDIAALQARLSEAESREMHWRERAKRYEEGKK